MKWQPENCREAYQGICEAKVSTYEELFECTSCARTNRITADAVPNLRKNVVINTLIPEGKPLKLKSSHITAIVLVPFLVIIMVFAVIHVKRQGMPQLNLPSLPNISSIMPDFSGHNKDELLIENEEVEEEKPEKSEFDTKPLRYYGKILGDSMTSPTYLSFHKEGDYVPIESS